METTGSGDATVRYEHGDKPYYDIQLQGVMLGDEGVKLQNLTQINADGILLARPISSSVALPTLAISGTNNDA